MADDDADEIDWKRWAWDDDYRKQINLQQWEQRRKKATQGGGDSDDGLSYSYSTTPPTKREMSDEEREKERKRLIEFGAAIAGVDGDRHKLDLEYRRRHPEIDWQRYDADRKKEWERRQQQAERRTVTRPRRGPEMDFG
jgi:hypothetical protein